MSEIDFGAFARYQKAAPRYTSYPTAVEFKPKWQESDYKDALKRSDSSNLPLSLYVHLPFCRSACYFCGCNVIYTSKIEHKSRYISYLKKELEILKQSVDTTREVVQFHFGGGTPTFFDDKELDSIMKLIYGSFSHFASNAEISCEIDPRYFNKAQMQVLKANGFNRLSFGVQDFNESVQKAINRHQSVKLVSNAVALAREFGINSINFDLIYGLPLQSKESFLDTLKKVVSLSPDRLAIFNYAHLPSLKDTMGHINEKDLPSAAKKLEILESTINYLQEQGYAMIGMDHFAKKSDELYLAKAKRELRRNFQGYTTRGFSQTIGIGLTSISEGLDYYSQNFKDMQSYEAALDNHKLPTERGVALNSDDILRKEVIMGLMNNLSLSFKSIEDKFGIDFRAHFAKELASLQEYCDLGLLSIDSNGISTTATGGMLIRNIAMVFDAYLPSYAESSKFSKSI